jgi:hypothetical protein
MTYRIEGLDPDLARKPGAQRVTVTSKPGFPCRVTLEDAEVGETVLLFHHVSHDVETPYRSAYAIYVREGASEAARYVDEVPPVMQGRPLGLRGFDAEGMLRNAMLALPGEADAKIRALFESPEIATIHAHNAAHGCFAAKIVRD